MGHIVTKGHLEESAETLVTKSLSRFMKSALF